jgi:hypothetical protein
MMPTALTDRQLENLLLTAVEALTTRSYPSSRVYATLQQLGIEDDAIPPAVFAAVCQRLPAKNEDLVKIVSGYTIVASTDKYQVYDRNSEVILQQVYTIPSRTDIVMSCAELRLKQHLDEAKSRGREGQSS